jgi:uncharacterized membrane protein YsdA (DUF1294 family)
MRIFILLGLTGFSFLCNAAYPQIPVLGWYALHVNLFTLLLMGADKASALRERKRVPEILFHSMGLFGGVVGIWLGVLFFRHKRHNHMFLALHGALLISWIGIVAVYYGR